MDAIASLRPEPDGSFCLLLQGNFAPDWAGPFCSGLGARRIDVERGFARQVQRGEWHAQLVIRALEGGPDPAGVDFRALAVSRRERPLLQHPRIAWFHVEDRGDAVCVSLRAPDGLGLLGRVLGAFSLLMLFVHEMHIETAGGEARDRFVLKGLAGAAPGPIQRRRLQSALQAMLEPPAIAV